MSLEEQDQSFPQIFVYWLHVCVYVSLCECLYVCLYVCVCVLVRVHMAACMKIDEWQATQTRKERQYRWLRLFLTTPIITDYVYGRYIGAALRSVH